MKKYILFSILFLFIRSASAQYNTDSLIVELNKKIEIKNYTNVKIYPKNRLTRRNIKICASNFENGNKGTTLKRKLKITKSGVKEERVIFHDPTNKIKALIVSGEVEHFRWTKLSQEDLIYIRNLMLKKNNTIISLKQN